MKMGWDYAQRINALSVFGMNVMFSLTASRSLPIIPVPFFCCTSHPTLLRSRFPIYCKTAGSEAIDLAAAPILSEVALAVTSNDPSPTSSAILGGGVGGGSTASPLQNITQSLDSTLFSSPSHSKLPSNAIIGDNDPHQDGPLSNDSYTGSMPLSERLRQASSSPSAGVGTGIRTSTLSDGTGQEGEFSPQPPSLSLSPSATASPISSTPGSPVQSLNYPHTSSLIGTGNTNTLNTTTALSGVNLGHGSLSDGGAPVMGLEVGDNTTNSALSSPPGSAMSGGGSISLSGNKEPVKRRLSMIRYVSPFFIISQTLAFKAK